MNRLMAFILFILVAPACLANQLQGVSQVYNATQRLENTVNSLQGKLADLRKMNEALRIYNQQLPLEISRLRDRLFELQAQEQMIVAQAYDIQKLIHSRMEDTSRMQGRLEKLNDRYSMQQDVNSQIQQTIDEHLRMESELYVEVGRLQDDIDLTRQKIEEELKSEKATDILLREKLGIQKELIDKKKHLTQTQGKLDAVKGSSKGSSRMLVMLEDRNKQLRDRLAELQEKEKEFYKEHEGVVIDVDNREAPVFLQWNDLKVAKLQREIRALKRFEDELKEDLEEVSAQPATKKIFNPNYNILEDKKLRVSLEVLKKHGKGLKRQVKKLQKELVKLDREKSKLEEN